MERTHNAANMSSKTSKISSQSCETSGRVTDKSHQASGKAQSTASSMGMHGQQMNSGNLDQRQQQHQGHTMSSQSGNHMGHQMNSGACDKEMGGHAQKQHSKDCATKSGQSCDKHCGQSC